MKHSLNLTFSTIVWLVDAPIVAIFLAISDFKTASSSFSTTKKIWVHWFHWGPAAMFLNSDNWNIKLYMLFHILTFLNQCFSINRIEQFSKKLRIVTLVFNLLFVWGGGCIFKLCWLSLKVLITENCLNIFWHYELWNTCCL